MAEPLVKTINEPNSRSTTTAGASQNFLRTLKKPHMSRKNSINTSPISMVCEYLQLNIYDFFL